MIVKIVTGTLEKGKDRLQVVLFYKYFRNEIKSKTISWDSTTRSCRNELAFQDSRFKYIIPPKSYFFLFETHINILRLIDLSRRTFIQVISN